MTIRADDNKRAEQGYEDLRFNKIEKKAYDKLGDLRQKGEDAYKRCFTERAPQQPSFAEATKQAQALLAAALGKEPEALCSPPAVGERPIPWSWRIFRGNLPTRTVSVICWVRHSHRETGPAGPP